MLQFPFFFSSTQRAASLYPSMAFLGQTLRNQTKLLSLDMTLHSKAKGPGYEHSLLLEAGVQHQPAFQ